MVFRHNASPDDYIMQSYALSQTPYTGSQYLAEQQFLVPVPGFVAESKVLLIKQH